MTLAFGLGLALATVVVSTLVLTIPSLAFLWPRRLAMPLHGEQIASTAFALSVIAILVAWARPIPAAPTVMALALIPAMVFIAVLIAAELPPLARPRTLPAWAWSTIYATSVLGLVILALTLQNVLNPEIDPAEPIVATGGIVLAILPQLRFRRARVAAIWAAIGAAIGFALSSAGVPPQVGRSSELIVALAAVAGITIFSLLRRRAGEDRADAETEGALAASQTWGIALRQSFVGFVMFMIVVLDWGIGRVR